MTMLNTWIPREFRSFGSTIDLAVVQDAVKMEQGYLTPFDDDLFIYVTWVFDRTTSKFNYYSFVYRTEEVRDIPNYRRDAMFDNFGNPGNYAQKRAELRVLDNSGDDGKPQVFNSAADAFKSAMHFAVFIVPTLSTEDEDIEFYNNLYVD